VTCAGCHMTASRSQGGGFQLPGVVVLDKTSGVDLEWPDVLGFVHVDESRNISPSLQQAFLPFRRYVLSRYLCGPGAEPGEPGPTPYEPTADMPAPQAVARVVGPELVDETGSGSYFVEQIISEFGAEAGLVIETPVAAETGMAAQAAQVNAVIENMSETDLAALRLKVTEAIALARSIELKRPGAFVETRRPH
jgi:hypothetical protein